MADNPFSVFSAARAIRERPAKVDRAVAAAQIKDGATIRSNEAARLRAQPSSYAPRAGARQSSYGAPMGAPVAREESAVERAARGQRNPGAR